MVDILHAFKLLLYIVSQSTSPNIDGPVEHQGYVVDLFRIGSVFMETPEWQKQKKWWKGSEPVIEAENSCEKNVRQRNANHCEIQNGQKVVCYFYDIQPFGDKIGPVNP